MIYSTQLLTYFHSLKHAAVGKVDFKPTVVARAGQAENGDCIHLFLKIERNCIMMAAFHASGCAAMLGAAEYLCAQIESQSIESALLLTSDDILNALELPSTKQHVSVLLHRALAQCLRQYKEIP